MARGARRGPFIDAKTARSFHFLINRSHRSHRMRASDPAPNSLATKFRYSPANQKEIIRQLLLKRDFCFISKTGFKSSA
ncbi:hypothetical protein DF047_16400 [Burkholderia cenocepacia]|nr:hypothetical protein DF047_16400 [Burkholderia cenocepacia]